MSAQVGSQHDTQSSNNGQGYHEKLSIKPLTARRAFEQLTPSQKLYAHYLSKASWESTRIIQSQVSPESTAIFDFILELYHSCEGEWSKLATSHSVGQNHLVLFQIYACLVLFNQGNYFGYGDTKFTPNVPAEFLRQMALKASGRATQLLEECMEAMLSPSPRQLGFPSNTSQSGYYPGPARITKEEVEEVDRLMGTKNVMPENTRVAKEDRDGNVIFRVLQSCTDKGSIEILGRTSTGAVVQLEKGENASTLEKVIEHLSKAKAYVDNDTQADVLEKFIDYLSSGDVIRFKEAQTSWVKDRSPAVEWIFGFVEQYRDPAGTRAEFQGIVALTDKENSEHLQKLVSLSQDLIPGMPWVSFFDNREAMGPFESARFEAPEFTSIHALTYCSPMIFLGINLPNYTEIRDKVGFKNVMIANRNLPPDLNLINLEEAAPFVEPSYVETYLKTEHYAWDLHIALHELIGHGTGNRLIKEDDFDSNGWSKQHLPTNPLTNKAIESFYKKGETVYSIFGQLTTTLQECRADCVGLYLITDSSVLSLFGYDENSAVKAEDVVHTAYIHAAISGLNALGVYDPEEKTWGEAHGRGFFAILRAMLVEENFINIQHDHDNKKIKIRLDSKNILQKGRKAIGALLLELHMWLSTGDLNSASSRYGDLTTVDDYWLRIRDTVKAQPAKPWVFIQSNTVLTSGGDVSIVEYEETPAGYIKSWAERFPRG